MTERDRVAAPAISLDRLTKRYGTARGVQDVTLSVEAGEVFGCLGPNGAGKTTLIRTMLDLIRPTSGTARILGMPAREGGPEIRRRIGYVPSEIQLDERATGRELIRHFAALRGGVDWAYTAGLARRLACDLDREIGALSHGNRQKIVLLQAFMHRPDLVLLDEPTQGLDPLVQREVHEIIDDIREDGQTVFLSSHVLPEVERLCHRVAILRDGRLAAVEPVGGLKERAVRHVQIRFAQPVSADVFAGVAGVRDLGVDGSVVRCTVAGSPDPLIKAVARFTIVDLVVEAASLEEVFMAFYGNGARDVA